MKVCVIGSGGREHTLAWKLQQSPSVREVFAIPGSAAMQSVATVVDMKWEDTDIVLKWLQEHDINLVVIGPEAPLVAGLSDAIRSIGIPVFGPSKGAAQIEGSKAFAKDMMKRYAIPTARYEVCHTAEEAKRLVRTFTVPVVIKADGLCAGKGVVICESYEEADGVLEDMLGQSSSSEAAYTVVLEEFMVGEEASLLVFVDGTHAVPMISAQDHKRIFDGDLGPNTGGMGTYAPAPVLTKELEQQAMDTIVHPLVKAMAQEGIPYVGCLYAGLMITAEGPKVVEFNARFGDPETQVVLPLLDSDLGDVLFATATGTLDTVKVKWSNHHAACVIMASKGYPESASKGDVIHGDCSTMSDRSFVFHSGTAQQGSAYVTNGGRVLGIVGVGTTLEEALHVAYDRVGTIHFEGQQYRKDIGQKGIRAYTEK